MGPEREKLSLRFPLNRALETGFYPTRNVFLIFRKTKVPALGWDWDFFISMP